jgi:hypothetical protein
VTGTLGISQPRSVDLPPPTLQTISEAIGKAIAIARARTRSRIMAVVKADGYGHSAITVAAASESIHPRFPNCTDRLVSVGKVVGGVGDLAVDVPTAGA